MHPYPAGLHDPGRGRCAKNRTTSRRQDAPPPSAASAFVIRPGGRIDMPRYRVQCTFPDGLPLPLTEAGAACLAIVAHNADLGVTWLHSYVSDDQQTMVCVYEGPDPEAIRKAAARNGLPVDVITQVSVFDPYC